MYSTRKSERNLAVARIASVQRSAKHRSACVKLAERAKEKSGVGGSFFDIFCSRPNFCVARILIVRARTLTTLLRKLPNHQAPRSLFQALFADEAAKRQGRENISFELLNFKLTFVDKN